MQWASYLLGCIRRYQSFNVVHDQGWGYYSSKGCMFEDNMCQELRSLFEQFLGSSSTTTAKGKGVLRGPPPRFAPKRNCRDASTSG
ncbi:hypothetical protein PVK06_027922 [Gossypium arboreum]|uniref:Uncharacterized protein n=1 Tax=Gossypium arboreum TaxID=29729 RepID=A0ABR0P1K3_GOSAR|nr:hypothetical protein PVK06_027922 [Gossypium arboreum]